MAIDYVNREGLEHFYGNLKTYLSTKYATKEELEAAIANFGGFQVVSLNQQGYPDVAEPSTKVIYLTKESGSQKTDPYTEWICTNTTGPVWEIIGETTPEINEMIGATASTAGTAGLVPAPAAGDQGKVLTGDGNWSEVEEYTTAYIDNLDWTVIPNTVIIGGREYPYVQIGNQLWLAENLDWKFQYNGSQIPIGVNGDPATPAAWYYNNDEATYGVNGNRYGLLYNWDAMKYLENNKSTLLPDGWRIPTTMEWDALATAVGGSSTAGTKLKSTTGWDSGNGDGSYDFAIFPAGSRYAGSFSLLGSNAYFWVFSTSLSSYFQRSFNTGASMNSSYGELPSISCYSIRLVKDVT